MVDDHLRPASYVLLFYVADKFAARHDQYEPLLAKTSAYVLRNPYFFRSRVEDKFLLMSIPEQEWKMALSAEERATLRAAIEAAYLSRGYPPSEDNERAIVKSCGWELLVRRRLGV